MGILWSSFNWQIIAYAFLAGLVICQLNLYLTTAVLHRGICHGAIVYPNWFKRAVAVWLWVAACIPPLTWVASHLHHHVTSDTEADPHSPIIKGFWHVTLLTWYYVPGYARSNWEYAENRYLKPYKNDRLLHLLDKPVISKSNFYAQMLISLVLGPAAIAFWFARIVPYMVLSGSVNAIGHKYGERKYENLATDAQTFLQKVFGYLIGGETLGHNYHHSYPNSSTFRPKAFDPGFWFATKILRGKPINVRN